MPRERGNQRGSAPSRSVPCLVCVLAVGSYRHGGVRAVPIFIRSAMLRKGGGACVSSRREGSVGKHGSYRPEPIWSAR